MRESYQDNNSNETSLQIRRYAKAALPATFFAAEIAFLALTNAPLKAYLFLVVFTLGKIIAQKFVDQTG